MKQELTEAERLAVADHVVAQLKERAIPAASAWHAHPVSKAGGSGHTNNSDQSAPKADPDGPPAPSQCHRKLCTAQSWVSCAISAIPKRSAFSQML